MFGILFFCDYHRLFFCIPWPQTHAGIYEACMFYQNQTVSNRLKIPLWPLTHLVRRPSSPPAWDDLWTLSGTGWELRRMPRRSGRWSGWVVGAGPAGHDRPLPAPGLCLWLHRAVAWICLQTQCPESPLFYLVKKKKSKTWEIFNHKYIHIISSGINILQFKPNE